MNRQHLPAILALIAATFFVGRAFAQGEPAAQPSLPAATPSNASPTPEPQAAKAPEAPKSGRGSIIPITRVVGEVGEHFVTSREARISAAVNQALTGKPATPEGFRIPSGEEKAFPGDVARVLEEWSVYFEAKALSNSPPSKTEAAKAVALVQERWSGHADWTALEVGAEELKTFIDRKLVAQGFERLKSDPQLAPVSDEEAQAYFKKNRLRFGTLPFESFKDNIKAFLVKQQTDRRLAEWHEVLRRKYKVRNFISG